MPLASSNTLKIQSPEVDLIRGRKPVSLLDILDQTPSGYSRRAKNRSFDPPANMNDSQMLAFYKLCLSNFAKREGYVHDPTHGTHNSFIATTAHRVDIARYTSALLEGLTTTKELAEDKLICYFEFDLDKINMKKPNQKHIDLMPAIQWRIPPFLRDDPAFVDAINRFDEKISRLLVPFANNIAHRRGYSPDYVDTIQPLTVDPEVECKFDDPIWLEDDEDDEDDGDGVGDAALCFRGEVEDGVYNAEDTYNTRSSRPATPMFGTQSPSASASRAKPSVLVNENVPSKGKKGKEKAVSHLNPLQEDATTFSGPAPSQDQPVFATYVDSDGNTIVGTFVPIKQVPLRVTPLSPVVSQVAHSTSASASRPKPQALSSDHRVFFPSGSQAPRTPTSKFRPSYQGANLLYREQNS